MKKSLYGVIVSLFVAVYGHGATRTWTGDGADGKWSTAANWGGTAPVANDSLVFAGTKNLLTVNDLSDGTRFTNVTFNAGAGAFSLSGNRFLLAGSLANNGQATQTVACTVSVTDSRTVHTLGPVVFSGALDYQPTASSMIYKTGSNAWIFTGSSTMITSDWRKINMQAGMIRFASNSVFRMPTWNATARDTLRTGDAANQQVAMVVEPGADVTLGNIMVNGSGTQTNTSFDLTIGGRLYLSGTDQSFGDQQGSKISVVVADGGTLTMTNAGTFNMGTRSPMTMTIEQGDVSVPALCFGRGTSGSGRLGGGSILWLKKGSLTINGTLEWDSAGDVARTNRVTLGDGRRGLAQLIMGGQQRSNPSAVNTIVFNGGVLVPNADYILPSMAGVYVGSGGLIVSNAVNRTWGGSSTPPLRPDPALGSTVDGGITKQGSAELAFSNPTNYISGPIRVEDGKLRFSSAILPGTLSELVVAEGKNLSLRGSFQQVLSPARVQIGGSTVKTTLEMDVDTAGGPSSCDRINLPRGAVIGKLSLYLYPRSGTGLTDPITVAGDYPLFGYETEPDVRDWTHENVADSVTSSFYVDRVNKRVGIRLTMKATAETAYTWANPLGGNWDVATNWSSAVVPVDSPYAYSRLWSVLAAPATVTVNRDVRQKGISFRGTNYTVSGTGRFILGYDGVNSGEGYLVADTGTHVVDVPVVAMTTLGLGGSGTTVVNRAISGNAAIYTRNNALVYLNAANSFTGGMKVTSGSILVTSNALAAGSGPLIFNGGRVNVSGSYTIPNAWEVNATSILDIAANTVRLSGPFTASGGAQLMRRGTGTLELAGSADFTATYPSLWLREGITRVVSGVNYSMVASGSAAREMLFLDSGSSSIPVALEIETGATVNSSGLWVRNGSATVWVKGTFTTSNGEVTLANTESGGTTDFVVDGGQYVQGDQWFMLGVNSLARLIVTNGGSAVVGRLSLAGYGDNMGGSVRSGSAVVQVAPNSVLDVRNSVIWLTGLQANTNVLKTAILRVDGGTAILPASSRNPASLALGVATVVLNGGRLVCSGLPSLTSTSIATPTLSNYFQGVDAVLLGQDSTVVDTLGYDVTVTQPLRLEQASSAGLVKEGAGALTLAGGIVPVPVTLNQGTLAIANSNRVAALTVNGGTFVAGSAWTVEGALTVGGAATIRWTGSQAGSFTLFNYGSLVGSVSSLAVVSAQSGLSCALRDTGSAIVVDVTAQSVSTWAADADGSWETSTNWDNQTVPNSAASMAVFNNLFSTSRTVTLGSAVVLATLQMNAQLAPLVQGGSLAVGLIDITAGQPVIASPLQVNGQTVIQTQAGARALLAGEITGSGSLVVNGAVSMTGTNLATAVTVGAGGDYTLGSGARVEAPIVLDGGALRSSGSAQTPSAIAVTAKGATVGPADSATLTLSGSASSAGVMTKVGNGTLQVPTLPNSALVATIGSIDVTATAPQTWTNALTINNTVADTAVVLRHAGDLTLSGPVNVANGRLLKTGAGTLSLTYPGKLTFASPNAANADQLVNIGPNGESPTQGLRGLSIVEGTVVLGVPGQVFTLSGAVQIGMNSTTAAGQEKAAHMIFNDGTFVCSTDINVGRGNGSTVTAPVPLQSSFTMNGGTLTAAAFSIGHRSGLDTNSVYQASPRVTINAGVATVSRVNLGEYQGCQAEFTVNGGLLTVTDLIQFGNQWPGGTGVIRVNGGRVEVANSINLGVATGSTGTLYLAGGVCKVNQIIKGSGYGRIIFDGGTLMPWSGPMTQPNVVLIREGGMKVDTQSTGYTIDTPIQRASDVVIDGGLTKQGPGYLRMSVSPNYNGPTLVSEGELSVVSGAYLPAATVLTIAPGAQFTGTQGASVTNMRTTMLAGLNWGVTNHAKAATLTLQIAAPSAYDRILVNGPVTIGTAQVQLVKLGTTEAVPFNGVYDLLTYQGSDPSVAGLSVANPLSNHAYAFSVDTVRKVVVLTITTAGASTAADAVWTAGSGVWNQATNWLDQTVPVQTTGLVTFPANLTNATVTVNTAATVGALNVAGAYTFDGASIVTLAGNTGAPALAISADTEFKNPLAVASGLEVAPQLNGRRLTVGSVTGTGAALALTNAGMIQVNGGTVAVPVNVKTGVLEVVNNGTISGDLLFGAGSRIDSWSEGTLAGDVSLGIGERVMKPLDGTLTVSGKVTGLGSLTKDGAGTLALGGANSYQGVTTNRLGFLAVKDGGTLGQGDAVMVAGTSFGAVGTTLSTVTNRTVFLGSPIVRTDGPLLTRGELVAPASYGTLSKYGTNEWQIGASYAVTNLGSRFLLYNGMTRIMPGVQFIFTAFGIATNTSENGNTRAQVALDGGSTVNGANSGFAVEPGASVVLGSLAAQFSGGSTNRFTLEMNGGSLLLEGLYPLALGDQGTCQITVLNKGGVMQTVRDDGWCDVGTRSPVTWIVDGGTSTLGRVAFGRKDGAGGGRLGGGTRLTINKGLWEARSFFSWKSVDPADPATNSVNLGNGDYLQGIFSVPPTVRYVNTGRVIVNQNGGILRLRPYVSHGTVSDFLAGVNDWNVGPGVIGFDVLSNVTATIKQTMTISASGDGGLVKSGPGTLTLEKDVALTGTVTIAEGCLKANLTQTQTMNVYSNGTMDLGMMPAGLALTALAGSGNLTNGAVSVSGSLEIGDSAATISLLRADALTLKSGTVVKFDTTTTTNDVVVVKNALAAESNVTLDFGREEGNPIAVPSREYVIATYGVNGGIAAGWKLVNTGFPASTRLNAVVTARNGVVTVQVRYGGMVMILR